MCGLAACNKCGRVFWVTRKLPRALTECIKSKRFNGVSRIGVRLMALALLMQISIPPKSRDRGGHRRLDLLLAPDIARERQGLSPGGFDLRGGGVDRAGQRGMGGVGLGRDRDMGAVPGRP